MSYKSRLQEANDNFKKLASELKEKGYKCYYSTSSPYITFMVFISPDLKSQCMIQWNDVPQGFSTHSWKNPQLNTGTSYRNETYPYFEDIYEDLYKEGFGGIFKKIYTDFDKIKKNRLLYLEEF